MDAIDIWYLTDNDEGKGIAQTLSAMGFSTHFVSGTFPSIAAFDEKGVNLFIIDFSLSSCDQILDLIRKEERIRSFQKIVILPLDSVEKAASEVRDILHIDFVSRPYNKRELLLLLEKSAVVEKYREIMKSISHDAEGRIEAFESLMHIHQGNLLESDGEKAIFDKIVIFERRLLDEQKKLNDAIREFASHRQKELFEIKNRLQAEELLDSLRRNEMLDAHDTIKAQQAVLDFSAREISETNRILQAAVITHELSREEALVLHDELEKTRKKVQQLEQENAELKKKCGIL